MTQAKRLLTLLLLVCLAAGPLSLPSLALNEAKIEGGSEYATVQAAVDAAASAPIPHRAARLLAGLIRRRNK